MSRGFVGKGVVSAKKAKPTVGLGSNRQSPTVATYSHTYSQRRAK